MLSDEERQELDMLYGPARPAGGNGVQPHELTLHPRSWQKLDSASATALDAYLARAAALHLSNLFPEIFHLLWIVDEEGDLWFSVEEVVDQSGVTIGMLPKTVQARPLNLMKLGHPALIADPLKLGRIGGEVVFDPDDPDDSGRNFCLTNASGRYGLRSGQRREHLQSVAGKFEENGLSFWLDFQTPR
ncbi:hypothetical protein H6M51_22325 [Rhizobium sp. AQ_MP]|uniref:hypothetical protein n=1 Tax=Rhizobium sp. AQ_MP TaxID=2761536 RepID=UPI0016396843|nr:hypothetical protein [Rhizobium sp. AQ_MP]MBC2775605.1 hypothetical protein [Rhizobium sp. AQ_MP]